MQTREPVLLWVSQKLIAMRRGGWVGYGGRIWPKASRPEVYSCLSQW